MNFQWFWLHHQKENLFNRETIEVWNFIIIFSNFFETLYNTLLLHIHKKTLNRRKGVASKPKFLRKPVLEKRSFNWMSEYRTSIGYIALPLITQWKWRQSMEQKKWRNSLFQYRPTYWNIDQKNVYQNLN